MRFAEKFLGAQMCLHSPSTRSLLRKQGSDGSQRCFLDRGHICVSACMTQTTEYVVMHPHAENPTIHLLGQNNRVVLSASDFISSIKKGLVIGIPNRIPYVLNATGHRNTEDVTSLLKWILHYLNQAYKLVKSCRLRTLS